MLVFSMERIWISIPLPLILSPQINFLLATEVFYLIYFLGWYSYLWLPFVPLIVSIILVHFIYSLCWTVQQTHLMADMVLLQIILLVGTKLQVIITKMGLRIQERGEIVKGTPLVQPGDDLFWFNRPRLILYLIHFVLFQVPLSNILLYAINPSYIIIHPWSFFCSCRMPFNSPFLRGLG